MNNFVFNPASGPIIVDVEATGPARSAGFKLILDTGATTSLIRRSALRYLGIDPDQSPRRISMTTGSTVEVVPVVTLTRLSALGQHRFGFPILAYTLPKNAAVDGLLGLDFLRGQILSIDFRAGLVNLS